MSPPYVPRALREATAPGVSELVEQAKSGRLVLYVGAGVSAASPSHGPMGHAVANRLRHHAAGMLGCHESDLAADTLEDLASKVSALGQEHLSRLRHLAATAYDFSGLEPNYGHRAIAMLMREGLVRTITVNWDCAVERAGLQLGVQIVGVTSVLDAQSMTTGLPLYKVHGSSPSPDTLKITREDVDSPQSWAVAEVRASLTSGTIVFVGLATVGDYVADPIEEVLRGWAGYASSIRVVAPSMPSTWQKILGGHANGSHFGQYANDFFDDLLRALIWDCLTHVDARAHNLAALDDWATPMAEGACSLRSAFEPIPAHQILSWWREHTSPGHSGRPFLTDERGQDAMMTVAFLAGADGAVDAGGRGRRFSVRSASQYFEIIFRPGAHLAEMIPIAEDLASRRWEDGAYEDARTITFVVGGAVGRFPAINAAPDIAGAEGVEDDIDTDMRGPLRFVSVEDAVQGRLAG